uniref:Uncharacterized protein n=1 Tax=Rhodococcus sp. NS1 TaxID=402236 RepID=A0A097SQ92_9NOCA|nr:hypothetical protein LRS1606.264 [Rhodococcus sp. NS1]
MSTPATTTPPPAANGSVRGQVLRPPTTCRVTHRRRRPSIIDVTCSYINPDHIRSIAVLYPPRGTKVPSRESSVLPAHDKHTFGHIVPQGLIAVFTVRYPRRRFPGNEHDLIADLSYSRETTCEDEMLDDTRPVLLGYMRGPRIESQDVDLDRHTIAGGRVQQSRRDPRGLNFSADTVSK